MMNILAQVFGLLGALSVIIATQMKEKKKYTICFTMSYIFFTLSMLFKQAYSGVVCNVILLVLSIVSTRYEEKKFPTYLAIIFAIALLVGNIITYENIYSLLPAFASYTYLAILLVKNMKAVRKLTVGMRFFWMIYDLAIAIYTTFALDVVSFVLAIVAVVRYDIIGKKNEAVTEGK